MAVSAISKIKVAYALSFFIFPNLEVKRIMIAKKKLTDKIFKIGYDF